MLYRIEAGLFPHLDDTIGRKTAASIREALGIPVKSVRTIKVFTLEGLDAQQVNTLMAKSVLHDPVLQAVSLSPLPLPEEGTSWIIEVGYRPGVTDNEGRTARDTAALVLGIEDRSSLAVYHLHPVPPPRPADGRTGHPHRPATSSPTNSSSASKSRAAPSGTPTPASPPRPPA